MKFACMLLSFVLFLSGCAPADRGIQEALDLRSRILTAKGCSFTAGITADYGDELQTFTLDCTGDGEGNVDFTVLEPEPIRGITGTVANDAGKLTFGETALEFGLLTDRQISPVASPWILLRTLREGRLRGVSREEEQLRILADDRYEEDALQVDIFLGEDGLPLEADILYGNRRVLNLTIRQFRLLSS